MEVAAENATELPKLGRPRMKLSVHASQTVQIWEYQILWTLQRQSESGELVNPTPAILTLDRKKIGWR
jgi:hypothetical protein